MARKAKQMTLTMAVAMLCLTTCTKDTLKPPTVKVFDGAESVSYTSAGISAEVTDAGGGEVKSRGFAFGKSGSTMDTVFCGSGTGVFSANLNNLEANTTYIYEAFAKNAGGTGTSGKVTFTTRDFEAAQVTTTDPSVLGQTMVTCGGNVTNDGGATVTERGICWGTSHNPTTNGNHASAGSGTGEFTCNVINLVANTTYYVRAYAKNRKGTSFGEEKSFTTKDYDKPEVTTSDVTDISQTTAKSGGNVVNNGGASMTERGICWSTSHNPSVNDSHVASGQGTGNFTAEMIGLVPNTTYYVRAYATNNSGTGYGGEVNFKTSPTKPTVTTGTVTNITTASATGSGTVTSDGGATVTERGLCWSTSHNPSVSDNHVAAGQGTGSFTAQMTGLAPNTKYYLRAYATNAVGTSYSAEESFTTPSISVPSVTTTNVTNITSTSASGGGNVTNDGGATVTERGICWGTSHNPTTNGSHASSGTGTGNFTAQMTGLANNTTYYVRAYAKNSKGTAYGEEVNFKTSNLPSYTISVSANPSSGGTVSGGGTLQQGTSCTVRATAAANYDFVKWTENGNQVSTNANYTFTVTGNRTLVAHFENRFTIEARAFPQEAGTVTGSGTYTYGQQCTVRATPASGYRFVKWTVNGQQVSTNANYTFTVTGNRILVARFEAAQIPSVTTNNVSNITQTTATCGGNVINSGGGTVTSRGVCWSTSPNPTVNNSHTINGGGTGSFTSQMTGLSPGVHYYVRAYATNSAGTAYGVQREFTTNSAGSWLYYGVDEPWQNWGYTNGGDLQWAVMFPTSSLSPYSGTSITKIKTWVTELGVYTLRIYRGSTSSPSTQVLMQSFNVTEYGWNEFSISPLTLNTNQTLWVSLYISHEAGQHPAACSAGIGEPNARWVYWGSNWVDAYQSGWADNDITWMIRVYVTNNAKGSNGFEIELPQTKSQNGNNNQSKGSCSPVRK